MTHHPIGAGKSSFDLIDRASFFKAIHLEPNMTILDLACGAGLYTLAMAQMVGAGSRIIAVDLWVDGIAALRQSAKEITSVEIEAHVADIRRTLPVPSGAVDLCLMAAVLHDIVHEGDPMPMLREVARVLKPKGVLAVVEFKKQDGPPGPPKANRMRLEDVAALLLRIGFIRFSASEALGEDLYFAQFRRL